MHISLAGKSAFSQDIALPAQMSKVLPPWMDELISNNKIYVCGIEKQVEIKILFHSCILCLQKNEKCGFLCLVDSSDWKDRCALVWGRQAQGCYGSMACIPHQQFPHHVMCKHLLKLSWFVLALAQVVSVHH